MRRVAVVIALVVLVSIGAFAQESLNSYEWGMSVDTVSSIVNDKAKYQEFDGGSVLVYDDREAFGSPSVLLFRFDQREGLVLIMLSVDTSQDMDKAVDIAELLTDMYGQPEPLSPSEYMWDVDPDVVEGRSYVHYQVGVSKTTIMYVSPGHVESQLKGL